MNKRKFSRLLSSLTLLSLLLSVSAATGLRISTQARPGTGNSSAPPDKVSSDLRGLMRSGVEERASVIVQFSAAPSRRLNALFQRNGVRVKGHFSSFNSSAIELPLSLIEELASFPEVRVISPDRAVQADGHVVSTTGADLVRSLPDLKGRGAMAVDGTGIGIAFLDSGIYGDHLALTDAERYPVRRQHPPQRRHQIGSRLGSAPRGQHFCRGHPVR